MKRLIGWGVRLYPMWWRARYGDEFLALVEDAQPSAGDVWDVVRGATLMQINRVSGPNMVAGFALAGMVTASVWAWGSPDRYVSTTVLRVADDSNLQQAVERITDRVSLAELALKYSLYEREPDAAARMRNDILVRRVQIAGGGSGAGAIAVSFGHSDQLKAQAVTRELAAELMQNSGAGIDVLDPASNPRAPSSPNRWMMVGLGILAGAFLGLGSTRFRRLRLQRPFPLLR